jgi:hypothetical protein
MSRLLNDGELHTLALGERNGGASRVAQNEDVGQTRGELMPRLVLDVDNVEAARVALTVLDDTNTPNVAAASDCADVADLELVVLDGLARCDVYLDGVVDLDEGIRVADGAAIMGHDVRDRARTNGDLTDGADLELTL